MSVDCHHKECANAYECTREYNILRVGWDHHARKESVAILFFLWHPRFIISKNIKKFRRISRITKSTNKYYIISRRTR